MPYQSLGDFVVLSYPKGRRRRKMADRFLATPLVSALSLIILWVCPQQPRSRLPSAMRP